MLEIKELITIKNIFDGLISRLNMAEEKLVSLRILQYKFKLECKEKIR